MASIFDVENSIAPPAAAGADRRPKMPAPEIRPLPVNRQRAHAVLAKYHLDGLIALRPHNVYYLTNAWPLLTEFGVEFPAMATFSADPGQPSFFIGTAASTWNLVNGDREITDIIAYSGVANWRDYVGASAAQMKVEPLATGATDFRGIAVKPDAELSRREAAWKGAQEIYNATSAASIEWALVRALRESGLLHGRLGVDDMRVAYLLQTIGVDTVALVPGDNIFREIRLVKQPHEIAWMRQAQMASRNAALAAARALVPGMTYAEARAVFTAEAAAHGADIGWLLIGVTQALLPDETIRTGRSYMIDCGATYQHYMGDFGRTIAVGDPGRELLRRMAAQQIGKNAALERIRPGLMFSDIENLARDAMIKAGMPVEVIAACNLHSVGLQHDDQPNRPDVHYNVRQDLELEEGMCVTLDLPFIEIGWGAGHSEDLLHITRNGYELMNSPEDTLIVV